MIACPRCGFSDHVENAVFCERCGQLIGENHCINANCPQEANALLSEEARFCPFCGELSYYSSISVFPED